MREISLHLLDIAENSVAAEARNIHLQVHEDLAADRLWANVKDDGRGMSQELVAQVVDPFITSRTTRKVGLGIPLLKAAAEACAGELTIASTPGKGTDLQVAFQRSHIDRMPLGDLASSLLTLIVAYPEIHWQFDYRLTRLVAGSIETLEFNFDDIPVKEALEGIPLCEPEVLSALRQMLEDGVRQIQQHLPD